MIVGSCFRGDSDEEVMLLQHDVYYQALGIISGTCQEHTNLAHRILDDRWDEWEFVNRYDHRTLQRAHDTIAAAWRFRCLPSVRQIKLPTDHEHEEVPDFVGHWLDWLQAEVQSWKDTPYKIRLVIKILRNQNKPAGYRAEADLNWELIVRYDDVPWDQSRMDAADTALKTG